MAFPTACLCENLRRTTRVVTRAYDDALRPLDLRITQFSLLTVLATHGEMRIRDLARGVLIEETAMLRNLRPLASRGIVTMRTGDDRRERYASLSDAGKKLLREAIPLWKSAQKKLQAELPASTWDVMFKALPKIADLAA